MKCFALIIFLLVVRFGGEDAYSRSSMVLDAKVQQVNPVEIVQRVIGQQVEIGSCRFTSQVTSEGDLLLEINNHSYPGITSDEAFNQSYVFTRARSNLSRIKVDRGIWSRSIDRILLEHVDIRNVPAVKDRIEFFVVNHKIERILFRRFLGSHSNVLDEFTCNRME